MFLFGAIVIAYILFITVKMMNQKGSKFEHFEDASYNYRMEVMKVFDLYLNRNPTTEEIDKYSALKNEQDILTKILTDFNISTVDVDKVKMSASKQSDEKVKSPKVESNETSTPKTVEKLSDEADDGERQDDDVEKQVIAKAAAEIAETTKEAKKESFKENTKKMMCIPKQSYEELKTLLLLLQTKMEEKEF